jgi:Reverse transcriptase (RNA-dependent DNA polymerase)
VMAPLGEPPVESSECVLGDICTSKHILISRGTMEAIPRLHWSGERTLMLPTQALSYSEIVSHSNAFVAVQSPACAIPIRTSEPLEFSKIQPILIPQSIDNALHGLHVKEWRVAIERELDSLCTKGTWDLSTLPKGRKAISCWWVFAVKYTGSGEVEKFKTQLVARGFLQQKSIDYEQVYAFVARMTSLRVILTVATHKGLIVEQLDVKSAYLNGLVDTKVYMHQPLEFLDPHFPNLVRKLNTSLYDLKQQRIWNDTAHAVIIDMGFHHTTADHCVY